MSVLEGFVLNGLNLQAGNFVVEAIDLTPPKKKPEWAQSADADGADLIRTPLFENRTITATVRVTPQSSMDNALKVVGELVDQLQEAEKNPQGIPLEWTPANSTKTITFYVLTGEVTGIPVVMEGDQAGWFAPAPKLTISLTCKPFGYGAEVEAAAAKSIETGLSIVTLTIPAVAGDVPAEGRLVITDTAAVGRRFVEWGLENRYYNAATKLVLDSEDMVPVAGKQTTAQSSPPAYRRAGATKSTIDTVLLPEPTVCCNTGVLKHVGTFRVKLRCASTGTTDPSQLNVRLSWQDGEGPFRGNMWQHPSVANGWAEVDLGTITVTPTQLGTQKWVGQIEAYSTDPPAQDILYVDYLTFIPVLEGYGRARGVQSTAPGTVSAFDNFTTGTLSGNLNARTPAIGTVWATSGAATDWTVASGYVERTGVKDTEPRFAVFGGALGNCAVRSTLEKSAGGTSLERLGVIARWTNATNYAFWLLELSTLGKWTIQLGIVVAGVTTVLAEAVPGNAGVHPADVALTVMLDGSISAVGSVSGTQFSLSASSTVLATGGTLASGKAGFLAKLLKESYWCKVSNIAVTQLPAVPYCIQPSQSMEVRSDSTISEDSTGTYSGPVSEYRGSRFFVPQDGSANRTSRLIVKADRNDLEESDQQVIADAFTVQPFVTPRYHVAPR